MTFGDLNLNKGLHQALHDMDLTHPTAIQRKVFAPIMAGRDIVGIAQTGTGKTFAYLLPVLRLWKFEKSPLPQILIIVPTRELVVQVVAEVKKLTTYMNVVATGVYGGTNIRTQAHAIAAGVDIVVGTPGRLVDLLLDGVLKPKLIRHLVVDEVDEMLHMGFRTQLTTILEFLPHNRKNLMFSATLEEDVESLISLFSDQYEKIEAAPSGAPLDNIEQEGYEIHNFLSKVNLLDVLLKTNSNMTKVLVFVKSRRMADALYEHMHSVWKDEVGVIHSSKEQNTRLATVRNFDNGTFRWIIATDLIARGLDIADISHIINFDLPEHPEQYIHRIGRTGRAAKRGVAISFISPEDLPYKVAIEGFMNQSIEALPLPEGVVLSEELIEIEIAVEHVPFINHKMRTHEPSGPAFQEKSAKNKKVNNKIRHAELMKKKYKKPKTRGMKNKRK